MVEVNGELQRRLTELEERVARLEGAPDQPAESRTERESVFWALNQLKQRVDDRGSVLFTGITPLPTGETYEWQQGATTAELLADDWSESSEILESLGHPVRLLLLQRVITGTTATADLKNDPALGTTGQLYHHLRRLAAAGWLRTAERGHYRVPPERVIPLLTVLLAARH